MNKSCPTADGRLPTGLPVVMSDETIPATASSQRHPESNADDVQGLVEPDRNRAGFRRLTGFLEDPNPPRDRHTGINQQVDESQHQPGRPTQGEVKAQPTILIKVSAAALKKMLAEAPALAAPFAVALSRVIAHRVRVLSKRYEDSIHFSRSAEAASAAEAVGT
jgi:hypothetical protein